MLLLIQLNLSMAGVRIVSFPKHPTSPMPRSSAKKITTFGGRPTLGVGGVEELRSRDEAKREAMSNLSILDIRLSSYFWAVNLFQYISKMF